VLTVALVFLGGQAEARRSDAVLLTEVNGPITPVVADHLREGVRRAAQQDYAAFIVRMDTPGGLDTAMRDIVKAFLGARVPVIVHVAPSGARAASAGAIIGLSANVLAMAPGTNIGAATPVALEGGEVGDKVTNDAAAYSEAVAAARGRDTTFARDAVRRGTSITADAAVERGVADLRASNMSGLLDELAAREIVPTPDLEVVSFEMGLFDRLRQILAEPNVAFLFLSIGSLALLYELANPGIQLGGIIGVILILLAFSSLAILPVGVTGAALLVLAVALFAAELFVPGVGVFAVGGAIALAASGLFLFRGGLGVDLGVLVTVAVLVGGGALTAGRLVWRVRRAVSLTGEGTNVGRQAVLRDADGVRGRVVIDGTWWNVRSDDPLQAGGTVAVVGTDGLELVVQPVEEAKG
jgi:membrane-bound serine protease (ClpP class)